MPLNPSGTTKEPLPSLAGPFLREGRQTMLANRDEKKPASTGKIMLKLFYFDRQTMHLQASEEGVLDLGATTNPRIPNAPRLPRPRIAQRGDEWLPDSCSSRPPNQQCTVQLCHESGLTPCRWS